MTHFSIGRKSPKTSQKNPTSFDQGTPEEYSGKHKPSVATPSPAGHRFNRSLTHELLSDSPTARKSLDMNERSQHSLENPRFKPFNHLSSPNSSTRVRTPDIASVRSKRGSSPVRSIKMPFVSKARDSDPDSDSNSNNYEVQRVQNDSRNHSVTALNDNASDRFSPIDPASVPVLLDKYLESPIQLETSTPNKEDPEVENLNPVELEEHLANEKSTTDANISTGSGFISSMLSAAHNAASHIISPKPHADIKSHPKSEETEALTTQGSSTSFVQHLDSILFGPGKKQSNSNLKNEVTAAEADEDYEHEDDGGYFDHLSITTADSNATKSNVRGINFEPVRKTNISTMGKGELRLEDLEYPSDQQQQLHPPADVISPVGTNFSRVLSDSKVNSSPNIPSLSVTSDDGVHGVDAQRVSQESASFSPIIGQQQSYQSVGNGRTTQFANIPSLPNRTMSLQRQEALRPNSMPLQSLELFNGSRSFTEGFNPVPNGGHLSSHSSRNSSRATSRATSPAPSSGATNGLRGRAKSLGSSLMPPNTSSTATTHGSRPTSYHVQNSLHPPRLSATFEEDSQQHHNNERHSGELSIASRSSSMARFPTSNGDGGGEIGGVDSFELKNVHYATAKRDSEFHNIFRKLPQTDRLIGDFACALQKDILVQGRLYLSSRHISFKANILGWVTNVIIPLKEIVRLEKRNTAGVFPNAIAIQTLHAKYTFSSFLSRDSTFELITNIWNQLIRGGDIGDEEFLRGVSGFNSEYSDDSEEDDDEEEVREEMIDENDDDDGDGDTLDSTDADEDEPHTPTSSADDESMGPLKHAPTAIIRDPQPNETQIIDRTIDAPLGKVYNVLFGDDTSKLRTIIERQGNKDISPIPAFTMDGSIRKRSYEYIKPLNSSVGPKQTLCQVSEDVDNFDFNSFVLVTQSTKNPDVPSGGAFVVITQIYLSWAENDKTKLQIFSFVVWNAKSWLKGPIESGTISGQKEALGVLTDELVKLLNYSGGRARSKSSLTTSDEDEQEGVCTLPTMGPKTHTETENEYKQKPADVFITEETFDVPLGTLYSVLFGDDTSYITQIIKAQKNREISEIAKFDKTDVGGKRTYNYIKPLSAPVGPKQTKCIITESIEQFNLEKSITLLQSTQTPDVPSGNAFTTNTNFYLSWGKNNSTKMYVVTFMNWTGKSWLKGPIEKGAIDGQKESIKILVDEVKTIIANNTTGKKRKKGKKDKKGKEDEENGTNGKRSILREEFLKDGKQYQINSFGILPNVSFLALFLLIITLLLVRFMGLGSIPSQSSSVTDINHVQINGQDYILMPLVSDLTSNQQLQNNAEFEIWEWINERSKASPTVNSTDQQGSTDTTTHDLKSNDYVKKTKVNGKEYEDQQLKDMIKIVEGQLSTLKKQLGKQDTMDAGVVVDEKETKMENVETGSVENL
ncbi:hypothetical protein WICPIJ_002730 [Wickerhamomyces pijperi]|uniref:VASt domain-containing protein n=1 Tax=Wickerhamomyces pijperi TaxID=599730 RepID=A0A9P8TPD0_WICPI|nr:hypothetical protein WICPIJ_002730 [Wickerhamomyces pijperi]